MKAAEDIINGASFDYNLPCIAEKSLIVVESVAERLVQQMQTFGALLLSPADTDKLRAACLPEGQANKKLVGKSPSAMLEAAGIAVPAKAPRLLIALVNADDPWVFPHWPLRLKKEDPTFPHVFRRWCRPRWRISRCAPTGAREGVIALKEKYRRAIDALTPQLPAGIRLHILPDVYPAGDEVLTIWMATGRRVAPAALPASVGVVVNNVQTVLNIARAVEQQFPVTRRTLTVNGAVARPLTVTVPVGMSLHEVLALAGGATVDDPGFINGGPMMGGLITSLDNPVTKTTGGLLVLPKSHPLIQRRMQDERTVLSVARTVCEQCRLCTDLCPRHLIGHELSPHLLVRAVNFHQAATPQLLLSALTCSECNVCESVACPVGISPMRINRMLKRELRAQNQRYEGPLNPSDEMAKYRLVPVKRLIAKLGLSPWYQEAPLVEEEPSVEKVTLQLRQHIGASAVANVAVGERVTRGQCVADVPPGALGAPIHASIDGIVSAISEQAITVVRG